MPQIDIWQKYKKINIIRNSIYDNIYKVKNKNTGYYYAIQEIEKTKLKQSIDILNKEIEIIKNIKLENNLNIKEIIDTTKYFYIIMDLCEYNLEDYIKRRENKISIYEIKNVLIQINEVLKLIQKDKITFRNLNLTDILISLDRLDKCVIKLCLFQNLIENAINGNLLTTAPEILNDNKNLSKSNLWSLGIIIYYMYFKEYPYNSKNEIMLLKDINSMEKIKNIENKELNDLINKLLKINIKDRISWKEYFNHPFFITENDKEKTKKAELIKKMDELIKIKDDKINLLKQKLKNYPFKDFNIKLKNHLTLNNHTDWVSCLTLLKDGRLVSGSYDKSIIIYNKENYEPDLIIKEHSGSVRYLTQLKNGILVSCSGDKTIKFFKINENKYEIIQTLNLHLGSVHKLLELSNNSLVSISSDSTIIFYINDKIRYKKDYSFPISSSVENINQTKINEIVYSTLDKKINFFDLTERKIKSIIEDVNFTGNSFCMIKKDLLLIPGENIFNIINVDEYKIIRKINILDSGKIKGVCMLNSDIVITSDDSYTLIQWKIEGDNLILISKKEKTHYDDITIILSLENGHIATGSKDYKIKIW